MSILIPFEADAKGATTTTELESGDLVIAGWGARFDTEDLESEWWDGAAAFEHVLPDFIKRGGTLCHAHRRDEVVGRVLSAEIRPEGVWLKAVVDHQPLSSPLRYVWEAVKRGRIGSFSAAGVFERSKSAKGTMLRISRLVEWSIAPISIGIGTDFSVVARKALTAPEGKAITSRGEVVDRTYDPESAALNARIDRLAGEALAMHSARLTDQLRSHL